MADDTQVPNEENTPPFQPFTALADAMVAWLREEGVAADRGIEDLDTFIAQIRAQAEYFESNASDIDVSALTQEDIQRTLSELKYFGLKASNVDGGNMYVAATNNVIENSELDDGIQQDLKWKNQYLNPYSRLKEVVTETLQEAASNDKNPVNLDVDTIDSFIKPTLLDLQAHETELTKSNLIRTSSPVYASEEELQEVKTLITFELSNGTVLTPASCAEIAMLHLAENNDKAEERIQKTANKSKRTSPTLQSQKQIDRQNAFYEDAKKALKAHFPIDKVNEQYGAEAGEELHRQIDKQTAVIKAKFDAEGIKPSMSMDEIVTATKGSKRWHWDPRGKGDPLPHLTPRRTVIEAFEDIMEASSLAESQKKAALQYLDKNGKYSRESRNADYDWAYVENPYKAVSAVVETTFPEKITDRFEDPKDVDAFTSQVVNHLEEVRARFRDNKLRNFNLKSLNRNIPIRLERRRLEELVNNAIISLDVIMPADPQQGEPNAEATAHAIAAELIKATHLENQKDKDKAQKVLAELESQVSYGVDSPFASIREALKAEYETAKYNGKGSSSEEMKNLVALVDAQVTTIEDVLDDAGIDVSVSKKAIKEGLLNIQFTELTARFTDQTATYLSPRTSITHHVHSILKESALEQTDKDKIAKLMKDPILVQAKEQDSSVLHQKDLFKRLKTELTDKLKNDDSLVIRLNSTEKNIDQFVKIFEAALDDIDKNFKAHKPPVAIPVSIDDVTTFIKGFKVLPEPPEKEDEVARNPDANVTAHALIDQIVQKAKMVEPHKGNATSELNAFESLIRSADYFDDPYTQIEAALYDKFKVTALEDRHGENIFGQQPNDAFYDTLSAEIKFIKDQLTSPKGENAAPVDLRITKQQLDEAMKMRPEVSVVESENTEISPDYLRPYHTVGQALMDAIRSGDTPKSEQAQAVAFLRGPYTARINTEESKLIYQDKPVERVNSLIQEHFTSGEAEAALLKRFEGQETAAEELRDAFLGNLTSAITRLAPDHPLNIRRERIPEIVNNMGIHPLSGVPDPEVTANWCVQAMMQRCFGLSKKEKRKETAALVKHGVEHGVNSIEVIKHNEKKENRFSKVREVKAAVVDYAREKYEDITDAVSSYREGPSLGPGVRSQGSTFAGNALVTLLGVGFVGVTAHESMNASSQNFEDQDRNWFQRNFRLDEWTLPKIILGLSALLGGDYAIRGKHSLAAKAVNSVSGQNR